MALYVSVVLLAALAALPTGADEAGDVEGVHGAGLLALIWGTTVGLALAHWFAFRVTARAFTGGSVTAEDARVGVAQLLGALVVAFLCSIPVVLVDDDIDVQVSGFVPALLIGLTGYLGARAADATRVRSFAVGVTVLAVGLAVAAVKSALGGH